MNDTGDIRIDEIMPRLSERWLRMPFEKCLVPPESSYRKLKRKDFKLSGRIPVIDQGETFVAGYTDDLYSKYQGSLPVVVFGDHTRHVKFVDFEFAVGADGVKLLHPIPALNSRFFYYYLRSLKIESQGYSRHYRFLKEIDVPIPPLPEQRRIVTKLEELLKRVDAAQARLAKIPIILKRFRQSVLAAACSGRLTADWRKENPDSEDSSYLIKRINGERELQISVESIQSDECPPDELPIKWTWVRFGSIIGELRNGVSIRPSINPPGIPILRINSVRPGIVDLGEIRYLSKGKDFLPTYSLHDRDLLFTRYNGSLELLGVCGMVRGLKKRNLIYPDKLMRVRFDHKFMLPEYVEVFFQAPSVHERVISRAKSSAGQNGVSGSDIKAQPVALPSFSEQQEIVRRVDALFKTADDLEARYLKAKEHVDNLTQSILARAFRGELVPQDPNHEPTSA